MVVAVTGSSGQLGAAVVQALRSTGETVVGLDIQPAPTTTHVLDLAEESVDLASILKGANAIIHTAALHAPQVALRSKAHFVQVNVTGTLRLLEAAKSVGIERFVYTSSTSVYGHALVPTAGRAVWVKEDLVPQPRDIYDVTKLAAEALCRLFAETEKMAVTVLRTGRFWDEPLRDRAIYRFYRGLAVADAVQAHLLTLSLVDNGYKVFNISSQSPFQLADLEELMRDAAQVIRRYYPDLDKLFESQGWALPQAIDRVYVIDEARVALWYQPQHNFREYLDSLAEIK